MTDFRLTLGLACAVAIYLPCFAQSAANSSTPATYDDHLRQAKTLLKENKLPEALAEAQAAAKLDPKGYEAPAAAALIFHAAKKPAQAKAAIADALKLAPAGKRQEVEEIAKLVGATVEATPAIAPPATAAAASAKLTGAARRQMDTLLLIIEDADKAKLADERKKLLREFMAKSADFVCEHPFQTNIWLLRAVGAMELDYPCEGWLAGRRLKELGLEDSEDSKTRKVFAQLDRKGWLGSEGTQRAYSRWTKEQAVKAAEEGDADAQFSVGAQYARGTSGCKQDYSEALRWYRKAAEAGNPRAQNSLALSYEKGLGVDKDGVEAVKWFRKAAEAGHPSAQNGLGYCYQTGIGVSKDEIEAVRWYRKAAATDNVKGLNALAWVLANSSNPSVRDGKAAVRFATKACELTQWKTADFIDTLASAYAEARDFENAAKYEQTAIKQADPAKEADSINRMEAHLKLFQEVAVL